MDSLYVQGKDYVKKGIGAFYEFNEPTEIELFYKTRIRAEADYISTNYSKDNLNVTQNNSLLVGRKKFSSER